MHSTGNQSRSQLSKERPQRSEAQRSIARHKWLKAQQHIAWRGIAMHSKAMPSFAKHYPAELSKAKRGIAKSSMPRHSRAKLGEAKHSRAQQKQA